MATTAVNLLLAALDQAYERKSWHGTNLRGSIRGMTANQAQWRPHAGRHCVAEQVLHAAYWKYTVRRRLTGEKRGSFPLRGSNWFPVEQLTEPQWREHAALLDAVHRSLREAIAALSDRDLPQRPRGSKVSHRDILLGIAAHDLYHTGQIQLLKRLYADVGRRG